MAVGEQDIIDVLTAAYPQAISASTFALRLRLTDAALSAVLTPLVAAGKVLKLSTNGVSYLSITQRVYDLLRQKHQLTASQAASLLRIHPTTAKDHLERLVLIVYATKVSPDRYNVSIPTSAEDVYYPT